MPNLPFYDRQVTTQGIGAGPVDLPNNTTDQQMLNAGADAAAGGNSVYYATGFRHGFTGRRTETGHHQIQPFLTGFARSKGKMLLALLMMPYSNLIRPPAHWGRPYQKAGEMTGTGR